MADEAEIGDGLGHDNITPEHVSSIAESVQVEHKISNKQKFMDYKSKSTDGKLLSLLSCRTRIQNPLCLFFEFCQILWQTF